MAEPLPSDEAPHEEEWAGTFSPLSDERERRVLFAALDSFRYVFPHLDGNFFESQ